MSVCARCPKVLGMSCCEVGDADKLATLTWSDVERISSAERLSPKRFVEEEWFTPEEASAYEDRRPLYRGYFQRSLRRLTLQRRGGACVFLEPGRGCRLSAAVRPSACRLYPIDVLADGTLALQVDRFGSLEEAKATGGLGCLAVEESTSYEALTSALGISESDVAALADRIREEVRAHGAAKK